MTAAPTLEERLRGIEDRLLRIEIQLPNLATKADVAEVRLLAKADLAEAKADILRWYVALTVPGFGAVILLVVGATVVSHFWK
jgi:hypothetical protein